MTSLLPVVFVVSPEARQAADLAAALPGAEVLHVLGAEALLREAHLRPPAAALLYDRTPGIPLAEVLPLLRQRAELAGTYWLAVGQAGLGALLAAGADALVSEATPPAGLALQVRTLLARAAAHAEAQTRIARLQGRLDDWEHEERVRDQLVHMLVHDLKNPITAVLGLLEVVEDDDRLPADLRELLKIDRHALGRDDAGEQVVDRPGELAPVHDQLGLVIEDVRRGFGGVRLVLGGALAHHVEIEDRALPGVGQVFRGSGRARKPRGFALGHRAFPPVSGQGNLSTSRVRVRRAEVKRHCGMRGVRYCIKRFFPPPLW